ncbi:uncharacterized protein J8A68_000223 [[Candida] subhashii]|uniref:Uncharacterized protein n=1 Tax=[Candida] subhashii TaxID=561895 RepID=A0A8J5UMP2_9ASCO|nr:uncharacterized protein J8A68_000223 [[Candida] subhashii]KAG7666228.1 hypothetical protein J8A68_000223 [[Candida] subhashii]
MNHTKEEVDLEDELNEILQPSNTKPIKFKKTSRFVKNPPKPQRPKLSFDEDHEDDDDDNNENTAPNLSFSKIKPSGIKFTKDRNKIESDENPSKSSSPGIRDLSKYRTLQATETATATATATEDEEEEDDDDIEIVIDQENPENNPVFENMHGFSFQMPPRLSGFQFQAPQPNNKNYQLPESTFGKFAHSIPGLSNSGNPSIRQLASDLGQEYKDVYNYDDGTGKQEPDKLEIDQDNDNDFELDDEDAGLYNPQRNRFDRRRYDLELSEDDLQEEEEEEGKKSSVKVLPLKEQIKRLTAMLANLEDLSKKYEVQSEKLLQQKQEVFAKKQQILANLDL